MLPPKNGKPITFKPTQQLREQTEAIADSLGESLSDYVRKAVAYYNLINSAQNVVLDSTHKNTEHPNPQRIGSREYIDTANGIGTHKNNTVSKEEIEDISNPTREIKPLPITAFKGVTTDKPKSTMVQTFEKGGGKK
jgi:hypothetical protein